MIRVVTGYVELPGNEKGKDYFLPLGEKLTVCLDEIGADYHVHTPTSDELTYKAYDSSIPLFMSAKDSALYHICQYEKLCWLRKSLEQDRGSERDVYAWIDFGIFKHYGVRAESICSWLYQIDNCQQVTSPGDNRLRTSPLYPDGSRPDWLVLGSVLAVPAKFVRPMWIRQKWDIEDMATRFNRLTWEVNHWSRMARNNFPSPWNIYQANHDGTLFDGIHAK